MNSNPFYMYSYSSLQTEIVFVGRKKVKLLSIRKKNTSYDPSKAKSSKTNLVNKFITKRHSSWYIFAALWPWEYLHTYILHRQFSFCARHSQQMKCKGFFPALETDIQELFYVVAFFFVRKCNVKPFICNKLLFDFIVQQQNFVEWGENNEKRQVYTLMRNACLALVLWKVKLTKNMFSLLRKSMHKIIKLLFSRPLLLRHVPFSSFFSMINSRSWSSKKNFFALCVSESEYLLCMRLLLISLPSFCKNVSKQTVGRKLQ